MGGTVTTPNGDIYAIPLNTTKKSLARTLVTLLASTAGPSGGLVLNAATKNIKIVPVTGSTPIHVNFGEGANTNASATVYDTVVGGSYPAEQLGREPQTSHVSLFSTEAQNVYVIELA